VPDPKAIQDALAKEFIKLHSEIVAETPSDKQATTHPMHSIRFSARKYQIFEVISGK
jgi:hypothetical protein